MAGLFRRRGTALLLVIVSAFLVAAIACEGTQGGRGSQGSSGPPGSQGSSGLQGPQGEAGPQGDSGDEGPTGTTGGSAAVLVVHDTANNVAGAVELKSSSTEMDVLGGGFGISELIALTVSINGKDVVLGSGQGNGSGAFLSTVKVPSSMKVGGPYTITAAGSNGNVGFGVVIVTNKNSSD